VVIPDTFDGQPVTSIREQAFYDCTSLTSLIIPSCVTSIGEGTFAYCTRLTSLTIPDSVTSIGYWAFCDCTNLTDIYCEASSKPSGWESSWDFNCDATVHWGYTGD